MIRIQKQKNELGTKDIRLEITDNIHLDIVFGGTGDIYWIYDNYALLYETKDPMYEKVQITEEDDEEIYNIFNKLYEDLVNARIIVPDNQELMPGMQEEDEKSCEESNEFIKNTSRYKNLVQDGIITWYSDEDYKDNAEILRISKKENTINIEFIRQSLKDDLGFSRMPGYYTIRFRMSGCTYEPCEMVFFRHFNNLQNYEGPALIPNNISLLLK